MPSKPDFRSVFRFLNSSGIRYVVVGGVASGLKGEPRATTDVDIITFLPRIDLERFINFARKRRIHLSARKLRKHAYSDAFFRLMIAGTQVDFIIGASGFEFDVLTRSKVERLFGLNVPVASPEDLILMKLVSGRALDWNDAKAIQFRCGARIDREYIESWAKRLKVQRGRGRVIDRWKKLVKMPYRF